MARTCAKESRAPFVYGTTAEKLSLLPVEEYCGENDIASGRIFAEEGLELVTLRCDMLR